LNESGTPLRRPNSRTRANFDAVLRENTWSRAWFSLHCAVLRRIFYNNCFKNGMLPVQLKEEQVEQIFQRVRQTPGYELTVDLVDQTIQSENGLKFPFEVDGFRRHCLLNGLDDIGLTLQYEEKISEFERRAVG
jgi:3-isopropylmalate dehydratase small subunit